MLPEGPTIFPMPTEPGLWEKVEGGWKLLRPHPLYTAIERSTMSWSASGQVEFAEDSDLSVLEHLEEIQMSGQDIEEAKEAFEQAKLAVADLIKSGAFGTEKSFSVSMSGHANVNNERDPQWVNDYVSINVSQMTPTPVGEANGPDAA